MKFINGLHSLNKQPACVATIGNFDGVHLGHQYILQHLKQRAEAMRLPLLVISFEPLPAEYFMPQPPARIYPLRDKIRLMQGLGVTRFLCLKFNAALANTDPSEFVTESLIKQLHIKHLAVGDDFRFGHQRAGDFALLKDLGEQHGMSVEDTATQMQGGERISSSRIRAALNSSDLKTAQQLLGHSYQLSGRVRHGDKRGRTIGFPTLNMKMPDNLAPQKGVYAVKVHGLAGGVKAGVANLGKRPTVGGTENRLEAHVFDFSGDVYGKHLGVELVKFLRAEQQFADFEALKTQISADAQQARTYLQSIETAE